MKKRLLYPGFIIFFLALPIAFPPTVSPAKYGGLLGSIKDAESAGDLVKETMTDLMGYLEDSFTAFDSGDTESIERIHEDLKELEGELALKAIPGSGLVEGILNTSQNVKEKLVEGWQSAKDKIDRFFSGDREAVFDSRIALSIDEDEHEWHESEGGVLDELPLQDVTLRSHGDYGDAAGTVDPQESEYYDTEGATGTPGHAETSDQPAEDAGPWEELYDDSEDIADAEEPSQPAEDTGPWEELNDDSEDIADAEASRQPAEDTGPWEELYDDSEDIADAEEPSQPAEDTGPWEELYDDSEDIADAGGTKPTR